MSIGDIDKEFYKACGDGDLQEVKRLMEVGADVNANVYGLRPLSEAAERGHVEVVQLLLDKGADIDQTNQYDFTAVYCAAARGHSALLAIRGADNEKKTRKRWTPLMIAAANNHIQVIEALVVFGADIDAVDNIASTPLMSAARKGCIITVHLLLSLNADTTKTDRRGRTVFQLAKNGEVTQLLFEHEKKSDEERKQLAKETMTRIRYELSIRLMRFAQPEIIGICLAFAPLELPPYVLLWITDFLPNYDKLSHHKKIELITSVRNSIWKLKEQREQ